MGRPWPIQGSRKFELKSALTVIANWQVAAFCWKKVVITGKIFLQCWNEGFLSYFWKWNWKLYNACTRSWQSRSIISVYWRVVFWSSKVMLFVFACNMAYYHILPTISRYQVKPYKVVIQLYTSGKVTYDNTFEILCTAPLTTEYFHISYTFFEHLLKKRRVFFLKQNF
jgi:hypothetical protein